MRLPTKLCLAALLVAGLFSPTPARAVTATYSWIAVPAGGSTVAGALNLSASSSDGGPVHLALIGADGYDQLAETIPSGGSYVVKSYLYKQEASTFALSDGAGHYSAQVPVVVNNPLPSIQSFVPAAGGVVATPGAVSVVPFEPAVTGLGIDAVSYAIDGVWAGSADQPPWQITLPDLPPGPHLLTASVFDSGDRSFAASETITTVRGSTLARTDTPHTASYGGAHRVTFTVTVPGKPSDPRPALGVTLSARPLGSTGSYAVIGHAVGDQRGAVGFPVTTKRSLELMATLDPVAGYAPAVAQSTLVVTTSFTCSAHRLAGAAGKTMFNGGCTVSPAVNGRPLVIHLGSRHGTVLSSEKLRQSRFSVTGHLTGKPLTLVLVLADGTYTSGATATIRLPAYQSPAVAAPPTRSTRKPTFGIIATCPPGYTSTKQCTLTPVVT